MPTVAQSISSKRARQLILAGEVPDDLTVHGHLDLSGEASLTKLPRSLQVLSLNLNGCLNLTALPDRLTVSHLRLDNCPALVNFPAALTCQSLELRNSLLQALPPGLRVSHTLDLSDCTELLELPEGLHPQRLILRRCRSLTTLPASLRVAELDLGGCTSLSDWPGPTSLRLRNLSIAGCTQLPALPEGLQVDDWLDVAQSGITSLPEPLAEVQLHWNGVVVDERIAFHPETLTAEDVLTERNAERRRVMVERVGHERIFRECNPALLDRDRDPGGERVLMRIAMQTDEDLVCLSVHCPSTGRQYILRVPPTMQTCRQAAAWLAGYDNPDDYRPIVET